MALKLPDVAAFKALPLWQRVAAILIVPIIIVVLYYQFKEVPLQDDLARLRAEIGKIDAEINTNRTKVKNLDELKRATVELEKLLAKNKELLPPEEEATNLLKQLSDLGTRIGLDFKVWKQNPRVEDPSRLFVKLPVDVEMNGGYHTLALFFDRISKLPRIINVAKIKMGSAKVDRGRMSIQTTFQLTAFASSSSMSAPPVEPAPAKPGAPAKAAGK
jgi:type IV pilus assembly protein PilO